MKGDKLIKNEPFKQTLSLDEKNKILQQRAKILSRKPAIEKYDTRLASGIEFLLGREHYFIESEYVVEVAHLNELTPLPGVPAFIMGIFNHRGKILAIINLKKMLNLPEQAITNHNRIIVLNYNEIELGVLADEIIKNTSINLNLVQTEIPGTTNVQNDFLTGITNESTILINIEKLMTDARITINQKI